MYKVAEIFNANVFNNKLDLDSIEIICVDYDGQLSKGNTSFGKYKSPNAKYLIKIVKATSFDNFYQIINVLAHELIHVYDMLYGEIFTILKKHCDEILSGFYVTNANNNQYVGIENYNVHGKYFKSFADKFNKLGFNVQQKYNSNGKSAMKKLTEKASNCKKCEEFFNETDDSNEANTYKAIKCVFDALATSGKRFVYRNAKEWFIELP